MNIETDDGDSAGLHKLKQQINRYFVFKSKSNLKALSKNVQWVENRLIRDSIIMCVFVFFTYTYSKSTFLRFMYISVWSGLQWWRNDLNPSKYGIEMQISTLPKRPFFYRLILFFFSIKQWFMYISTRERETISFWEAWQCRFGP